jgi:O-antigen ligase
MATLTTNHTPSYFEQMTGKSISALWILRGFTVASIVPLVLAMFVFHTGNRHDFCLGLSVGVLVGLLAQTFAISKVDLNTTTQPSDVQDLRITR